MRSKIIINLKILSENYLKIKRVIKKEIIVVLKDNAYGHDLIKCAKTLSSLGCKMIAVATLEEAVFLRKNLIFTPILLFERVKNYRLLTTYHITSAIHSLNHLKELASTCLPLNIHLEIETGFNRLGININEIDEALEIISKSNLSLKGIYTHYSDLNNYEYQKNKFLTALKKIPNHSHLLIHTSSSNYIHIEEDFTNCIRIGMCLYGNNDTKLNLKPVMSIYSYVLRCSPINKGEYVSYQMQEKAQSDGYVVTLGIGYGDGWKKEYNTIGYQEKYYNQIGVTNMDALMLFSKTPLKELSLVELLGEHLTLNDLVKTYQTDNYAFFASLSSRIPREFI